MAMDDMLARYMITRGLSSHGLLVSAQQGLQPRRALANEKVRVAQEERAREVKGW